MSHAGELLALASHLALGAGRPPDQACLRRSISTAYYGLFHLLSEEVAGLVAAAPPEVAGWARRQVSHATMLKVCKQFQRPDGERLAAAIRAAFTLPLPSSLVSFAVRFERLQVLRHEADYGVRLDWDWAEAWDASSDANQAVGDWLTVRETHTARLFLGMLLFPDGARR